MDDLDRYRDEFPILSHTVYMISNSLGPMPRRTAQNLAEYAEIWATRGVRAWEERWWEMPAEIGNKIAWTIGAPHGTVSMHENVTTAHMVALSTIRPTASRRRLVCSAMDFPSMIHLYRPQQASGFDLHTSKPSRISRSPRRRCSTRSTRRPRSWRSRTSCFAPRTSWTRRPSWHARIASARP